MRRTWSFLGMGMVLSLMLLSWCAPVCADDFAGSSLGIFTSYTPSTAVVWVAPSDHFIPSDHFTWGTGWLGSQPNSLQFTGTSLSGTFETTEFKFGTLTYYNGTITSGTEANAVDLTTTLSFPALSITQDFSFTFQIISTPNNTGNPVTDADYVKLGNAWDSNKTFTVGTTNYTLNFTRFGNADSHGFITTVDEFHVLEGYSASADMYGKLTANPTPAAVPVPPSILLLGPGLVGLAAARKRLKK